MTKDLNHYLSLPYSIELTPNPEAGGWVAAVRELPGCISQGDTQVEALEMIQDAMRGWLETALEDGKPIPQPRLEDDYSGKFVVRVAKSLHRRLAEAAAEDDVSLNQYVVTALASAVGMKEKG
ncbi:MAG: type II toxin-antitoxin system HicB family antitoxin [Chloroflexi bacterium]|nr:type II toxin-antitoxin system HicB family antitoxin [Chloroflexota bacterium]